MHIVFASSECVPFAKTGGLADVVGALGPELVKLGHSVTVYLPLYAGVRRQLAGELNYAVRSITIPSQNYNRFVGIVDGGKPAGVQVYFVDCPELFDREGLYGTAAGDYPEFLVDRTPHAYIFNIVDPVEASIARRRSYATILSHLCPPLVAVDGSEDLRNLHRLVHDYYNTNSGALEKRAEIVESILAEINN